MEKKEENRPSACFKNRLASPYLADREWRRSSRWHSSCAAETMMVSTGLGIERVHAWACATPTIDDNAAPLRTT